MTAKTLNPTAIPRRYRWRTQVSIVKHYVRAWLFGNEEGRPPNDWVSTGYFREPGMWGDGGRELSAIFRADATEIEIAEKWTDNDHITQRLAFSCHVGAFRRMALWYLWRWAWGEWFGLRRRLYYWDLHRWVKGQRKRHGV